MSSECGAFDQKEAQDKEHDRVFHKAPLPRDVPFSINFGTSPRSHFKMGPLCATEEKPKKKEENFAPSNDI